MPISRLYKTHRYSRHTYGDDGNYGRRNILSVSFVATDRKRPAASSATGLLAATALNTSAVTTLTVNNQADISRNVTITLGGTTANIGAGTAVVTGTNAEGATITENYTVTGATGGLLTGNKAFSTVTTVSFPATTGAGVTASIGWGNKLGINLRNMASMPIKVLTINSSGTEALEDPSASAFSATVMESNTFTPTTTPDGTVEMRVYVLNYKWAINPTNAAPDYGV